MQTVLLCCKTIEQELRLAMERTGASYECVWIESGLHNIPKQLTERLQQALDAMPAATQRVLMGFGYCGNAVAGLRTGGFEAVIPRADDCITLLLGSYGRRQALMRESSPYFLTQGWLDGERNIWEEYRYTVKKYGERTAKQIYASMLAHYRHLAVVDTGAYDLAAVTARTEPIARELGLAHQVVDGTTSFLERLLTGPWDGGDFLIVPPHATVAVTDLYQL